MPPKPRQVLFSLEPIEWLIRDLDAITLGQMLGSTEGGAKRRWQRIKSDNGFCVDDADLLATRLGYHPSEIWEDWWEVTFQVDGPLVDDAVEPVEWEIDLDGPPQWLVDHVEYIKWLDNRERRADRHDRLATR